MENFIAKFPLLQELFAKNHRGPFAPPPSGRGLIQYVPTFIIFRKKIYYINEREKLCNNFSKRGMQMSTLKELPIPRDIRSVGVTTKTLFQLRNF